MERLPCLRKLKYLCSPTGCVAAFEARHRGCMCRDKSLLVCKTWREEGEINRRGKKDRERLMEKSLSPLAVISCFPLSLRETYLCPLIRYCWAEALVADLCESCEAQGTVVYPVTVAEHIEKRCWLSNFPEVIVRHRL